FISTCVTSAVAAPSFYPMIATPGSVLNYFCFKFRRECFKEFTINCKRNVLVFFYRIKAVGKCHFTQFMMMAITFPICCNIHQLYFLSPIKLSFEFFSKTNPVIQQPFKCHSLRCRPVIEKQVYLISRRQVTHVSSLGIYFCVFCIFPFFFSNFSNSLSLIRRKYGKLYAVFCHYFKGRSINSSFSHPHSFRIAVVSIFKILNSPNYLGFLVPFICQGHYQMVECLCYSSSVT